MNALFAFRSTRTCANELIDHYVDDHTRVVDLTGLMALPGLHDSHVHPLDGGYLMRYCDVSKDGTSVEAITEIIAGCVDASDDEWIVGFGINLALFGLNGPDKSPRRLAAAHSRHSNWRA